MMKSSRRTSLQRLGALQATRGESADRSESNWLTTYYERHVSKNSSGRLSQRRLDAFLGLCASYSAGTSNSNFAVLTEGLQAITERWPTMSRGAKQDNLSPAVLKHAARAVFTACLGSSSSSLRLCKLVQQQIEKLLSMNESAGFGRLANLCGRCVSYIF